MTVIPELLSRLDEKNIQLVLSGDELVVRGKKHLLDPELVSLLREHKQALTALVRSGRYEPGASKRSRLPLIDLTAAEMERIAAAVPGGAANIQDTNPLAPLQEGILFHHLMSAERDPYLLSTVAAFDTRDRVDAFVAALQSVIDRHDILRTAVMWEGLPEPLQVVLRKAALPVEEVAVESAEELLARFDPRHYRLDVRVAPMMRVCIARDPAEGRWLLVLLLHHLAGDHTTMEMLQAEVQAHLAGRAGELPEPLPFRNYVVEARTGVSKEEHEAFFRQLLGDVEEPTAPFGLLDVRGDGSGMEEGQLELDPAVVHRLRARARKLAVSAATIVHVAWAQVLARVSGRKDVVFGTVLFGRMQGGAGADRVMGLFMNTLPVRFRIDGTGVEDAVRNAHLALADLMRHEHAPLSLAQRCSGVQAPAPLFSSLLNYRHGVAAAQPPTAESANAWRGMRAVSGEERTNYPLTLSVDDLGARMRLTALVSAPVDPVRVCTFLETAIEALVDALEEAPAKALRSIDVLPADERREVIEEFNATAMEYPAEALIHELFEEQVRRTPDAIAVVHGDDSLTYVQLNRRANKLARHLRSLGVVPDARVGICLDRGPRMLVSMLGVLKAGGAYVPLDPAYPADRLQFMTEDSAPVVVIDRSFAFDEASYGDGDLQRIGTSSNLAYVIYTSGSTGKPKGVAIEHRNAVNFITWAQQNFDREVLDRTLFSTSLSFDLAVFETFVPLSLGASLRIVANAMELADDVTLINTVPSAIDALTEIGGVAPTVRTINFAGEPLKRVVVEKIFATTNAERVCNLYGPSETTTYSTWVQMPRAEGFVSHIGRPVANTQIYLLDSNRQPVPVGVVGEIYIGGAGVARGYLNRPELTAERFLDNPFAPGRMYKTGDLGRWLPGGNLEFLGRNDHQVKIRGFRIELGEIESRLAAHPDVKNAVVIARDERLIAYYAGEETNEKELRAHVAAKLPEHMVPSLFVWLEALPLTPNGKIDRKALPAPDMAGRSVETPMGEVETALAEIWAEVLKLEQVGRNENFFELGGHSLLAVTVIERMRRKGLHADVRALFASPTIAQLAAEVGSETQIEVPPNAIPPGAQAITPEMLPLVELTQAEIDRIVETVPGGAENVQDIYPLAPLQEGILFHHLMTAEGDPYLLVAQQSFESREVLDAQLRALQAVIDRHDVLRTSFVWDGLREPVQVVWRKAALAVQEIAFADGGDAAQQLFAHCDPRRHRVDLRRAPVMRACVARDVANGCWQLVFLLHHLAGDHTALELLQDEMRVHLLGRAHELPAPLPFRDFVALARLGIRAEDHEKFFTALLADVDEPTAPFGLLDVQGDGSGIGEAQLDFEAALAGRIRERARTSGVSAASIVHLAWALALSRVSGRGDVVFGTVLFGRTQTVEQAGRAMGLFINTLPVRIGVGEEPVDAALRRTHVLLADLMRHEHASLALAQRCSGVESPAPLFSSLLNYRHSRNVGGGEERSNYPVTLSVDDWSGGFRLTAQVQRPVDAMRVCEFLRTAVERIVDALESAPATPLCSIDVLPAAERRQVIESWNANTGDFAGDRCLHELFEAQAARTPDAIAATFEGESLTYAQLNAKANRLAHALRARGVTAETRVAIRMERGLDMVASVVAVLKAGGAYVPIDLAYPDERAAHMIEDSAPAVVLTEIGDVDGHPDTNPENRTTPANAAYVIYTSGSTGVPKGVVVEHGNVTRLFAATEAWYRFGERDVWTLFHSLAFDFSVWELWGALLYGGRLVVVPKDVARSPEDFYALLCRERVTVLNQTPSAFRQLIAAQSDAEHALRTVIFGGEALEVPMLAPWFERNDERRTRLVNMYGITETTVHVTYRPLQSADTKAAGASPIGIRIPDLRTYILDAQRRPVPVGVTGELYVGGAGVARGYLNRPELTAERFLDDPFAAGQRMYKTGDLGRWLPDGTMEFLGRNDSQVKIRGFRIELGEIAARLSEHAAVREAVVVARQLNGDTALVAYYAGEAADAAALRSHLSATLPDYMVPAAYVRLDAIPLTTNGKLDRKALPAPETEAYASREFEAPQGEVETALAEIWSEVLRVERAGRHDNFFELGGHSLLAVQVISRLRQALDVELTPANLFAHPVLADFARDIEAAARSKVRPIDVAARAGKLPLSFAQQRLWFLDQLEGMGAAYHVATGLRLIGELDRDALRRALDRIVSRHEALRTTFELVDGEPVQRIAADAAFALAEDDLRGAADIDAAVRALAQDEATRRFDLTRGPLIRGLLLRLAENEHALLVTMHHVVSDGWSIGIFVDELSALYRAFRAGEADPLPPLPLQYADYAVWQRRWIAGDVLQRQAGYWTRTLAGAPGLLELPADRVRPAKQDFTGGFAPLVLDEALTAKLKSLSTRHGATLFMTLLAGWAALLSRLSGQDDLVIGTPSANRGRAEIERLIGFFINTLALRIDLSGSPSAAELLERVKAHALDAQQNQDLPFEQVVELVQPVRSLAHSPLFQNMFVWQNTPGGTPVLPGLTLAPLGGAALASAKVDLTLTLRDAGPVIAGGVEFATSLFDPATVERMLEQFRTLLDAMASDETIAVDRLPLMADAERRRIVEELNATEADFPREHCIHELFEEQVRRTPDAVAAIHGDRAVTYAELNARANRVAHQLRAQGVTADARVAIRMERGLDMLVALLATWKAGGAYVPIDPAYPAERAAAMIADSAPVVVLTSLDGIGEQPDTDLERTGVTPESLAYVIYTSGSTGTPKGVMVEHRGVVNLLWSMRTMLGIEAADRMLAATTIAFDIAALELYLPLVTGGSVVILDRATSGDPFLLSQAIAGSGATVMQATPATWRMLLDSGWSGASHLRALCGGEALPADLAARLRGRVARLWNVYGPTETTIWSSAEEITAAFDGGAHQPIGRPIANTRIYILDAHGQPVPQGVAGELFIGGAGVARGYFNREALTAERFVADPFVPGARMYRTGDLARRIAGDRIEFLGRNDFQVKLRGFRIELGEIEARLRAAEGIREAVVVARSERLIAYVTGDKAITAEALRAHLGVTLPDYMIPAAYVQLDALPLTPNGKVDRNALPAPEGDAYAARRFEAPEGAIELAVAAIWSDVLRGDAIGRRDHFFERGGHSLLAVQVVSRVRQSMGVDVSLGDLFLHPVLADFARRIADAAKAELPPIVRAGADERSALSFAQQRLWFLDRLEGAGAAYHIPAGLLLRGDLDRGALRRALDRIVARHESLRTTFEDVDGRPLQRIADGAAFTLIEHDLRGASGADARLAAIAAEEASTPFDLAAGPLVRGRLVRVGDGVHALLVTMHHVVSDGWSVGVFFAELAALYRAFCRGENDPLPPLPVQYPDYAAWQRRWIAGDVLQQQADYWQATLAGVPELIDLPADRPRPARQDFSGDFVELAIDSELTERLRALSRRHGTTLFMTVLAGWAALLSRLSRQHDVVVGTPVANRGRVETEPLIGFFVNTLALRVGLGGTPSVAELLDRVKEQTLAAQQHQDIPFEQVVDLVHPARSLAHSPLFQVGFVWQGAANGTVELPGLGIESLGAAPHATSKFDLQLSLHDRGDALAGGIEYATALFDRATVARMAGHLRTLLDAMERNGAAAVDTLPLLDAAERHQLVQAFNATEAPFADASCVHELFEAHAAWTPEALALVHEDTELTYAQLNARANRLAHSLRRRGVGPDVRVAIALDRGVEAIVAMLAVMKAGGAYVPIDPAYPAERRQFMIDDSKPLIVLRSADDVNVSGESGANLDRAGLTPEHLAYVIYTSGSTGTPKGVMVEHRGVCNLVAAQTRGWSVREDDRILQFASLSFDASVFETVMALCRGAALVLPPRGVLLAGDALAGFVAAQRITHVTLPPAVLAGLPADARMSSVRTMILAGDVLPEALVKTWARGRQLVNAYGPTETTVWATMHECGAAASGNPPIGKPIANARIYIVDAYGEPVPAGVAGEICIGGAGVARGYLDRPELTAERFVADPFHGGRMYKTGDLGRWLPDGNVEFLGRDDFQVKLRGFRIELGEIEARLRELVADAAVVAREGRLVAYYAGDEPAPDALRAHLAAALPDYMVPAVFVRLDALPLTSNGKLDRKALPAPDAAGRDFEPPHGETEIALAEIWRDVLRVERVGRRDDFFELGGHSLLAVQAVSRIRGVLGIEVAVGELFLRPVLADFARSVAGAARADAPPIVALERGGDVELSFAQQRLWFLGQLDGIGSAYHLPVGLRLAGTLDAAALRAALDRIVARHDALRTTFHDADGRPVQRVAAEQPFALVEADLRQSSSALQQHIVEEAREPFDLVRGPLIRGRLLRLADDEHALLITMHHIVADGWSMGVLVNELSALYAAFARGESDPLPPLAVQYADYAAWQRRWVTGDVLQQQAEYWKDALRGAPELLELPADRVRPAQQDYSGATIDVELDAALTEALKTLSRRHGTTLFMTLLAAWAALLSRLSGQDDVVVGTATANRGRAEVEGLIGFFVNTLALRIDLSGSPSLGELLARVKATALAAQQHPDIPFEQVVDLAAPARSLSHSPLFQTMFLWQNVPGGALALPGLELQPLASAPHATSKVDLSLTLQESGDTIRGSIEYATALFDRATVERTLGYFGRLLHAMADAGAVAVDALPLLGDAERGQIVDEWNATDRDVPSACIHELFEEQVRRAPGAVAVIHEGRSLTYGELNARANKLAHYLRDLGAGPGTHVAICVERGVELMVGVLAILKAGGAYVPLDPAYPADRVRFAVDDSAPILLLNEIDFASEAWADRPETNPSRADARLAYVIYTSGSTGKPKGVRVPHRGVVNLLASMRDELGVGGSDRILSLASFAFDMSVPELFLPLACGAAMVSIDRARLTDPALLAEAIAANGVTIMQATPSTWRMLIDSGWRGERLQAISGAEALPSELAAALRERVAVLRNYYGPTETTVWSSMERVDAPAPGVYVPVGRPIANTCFYVLDAHGQPVPPGVVGEIFIGGAGVADGYLNQPELTAERFVADPFHGGVMYRTGDRGRWLADGRIEFLGRDDFQVKLRGFRIELGEIEARLHELPAIGEAVVVAREGQAGDKRLVAYFTSSDDTFDAGALREHLAARLPEYMVPAAYVRVDALPRTPAGKLDRKALPAPDAASIAARGFEPPEGATETMLAAIWTAVLGIETIGRHDNFFALGGHSLLALRAVKAVRQHGVDVRVADLFAHPTIRSLAAHIDGTAAPRAEARAIAVRAAGAERPLFLVHEGKGGVEYAQVLAAHLPAEVPVYALPAIGAGEAQLHTIEGMAERFIRMMRAVQPAGPYRIAGWSFGGMLAYEIATQLIARDEAVEFLGMFDTSFVAGTPMRPEHALADKELYLAKLLAAPDAGEGVRAQLAAAASSLDFDGFIGRCRELGVVGDQLTAGQLRRELAYERSFARATQHYVAHPIPIPVSLFTANEESGDALRGWAALLPKTSIRVTPVAGSHWSIMQPPNLAGLGAALSREIAEVTTRRTVLAEADYSPIVTLQLGKRGATPLFCVPGAGANVVSFAELAGALDPSWPIHGLQPRGVDGLLVPHAGVQAAAECYVRAIRQLQQPGPVHLLGHSYGGWVVFEMARRLRESGYDVVSLTIVDTEPPDDDESRIREIDHEQGFVHLVEIFEQVAERSFGITAEQLASGDAAGHLTLLHERLVQFNLVPRRSKADVLRGPFRAFATCLRTVYCPAATDPSPIRLVLVDDARLDRETNQRQLAQYAEAWRRWAPNLAFSRGSGNHMTTLKSPHVQPLAALLGEALLPRR